MVAAAVSTVSCKVDEDVLFGTDSSEIQAVAEGGTYHVKVTADGEWVASANVPWITVSPANGYSSADCSIMIDSTLVHDTRTGVIRIQDQATWENKEITVTQKGFDYIITVSGDSRTVSIEDFADYNSRYVDVKLKTNVDFDVVIPAEASSWLSVTKGTLNLDRGIRPREVNLRFDWDVNSGAERTADITFVPVDQSISLAANDVLSIVQGAAAPIEEGTRQGDSTALMAISRALNVWEPWDETTAMSTWSDVRLWEEGDPGYTAEKDGRVKYARFYMCGTEDVNCIPYEVRYLTAAEELVFYSNNNKEQLDLSTGPYLAELKDNLKRLTIAYFGLSELDPSITELTNLEYLNLAGNNFQVIPEQVFTIASYPNFHALLLNTNYRSLIYDLSNATKLENLGGLYDVDETAMRRLLQCENLDTLALAVNYLRGSLPTFQNPDGTAEAGVRTYVDYLGDHPERADSLYNLANYGIPAILPNAKFLSFNNNRFTGLIPQWLLYHPGLDWMDPFTLVFHQEGSLPREEDGTVVDAGFSNTPIDYDYDDIEGTLKNSQDGSNMGYYDMFPTKRLAPSNN